MRRTITLCLLTAAGLVAAGAYAGYVHGEQRGRDAENALWRNVLTSWGCAGHEFRTGEWVIVEGGTCHPQFINAIEPVEGD